MIYLFCILKTNHESYCPVNKYPHFGFKLGEIDAFLRNRYIVELPLLLSEKLEPPTRGRFNKLRYAKG